MTKLLRFTPAARADLAAIWDHTARHWDMNQADRYIDVLHRVCLSLAAGETVGRPVDMRPGTLKVRAGSHMVYVREGPDTLDVIRVLHQRQDVERNL
ncbi:type II toxin-antitoxin system RelE/ParE family toxin [Paracoccus sp. YLB-12]|uniref:Type II toxin-antitoxin system RelE/ParE family toxin n=1 Tax=Paracoccus maritimus TaxID=2933292 RepID=A0ABT2KEL4_9RHOB|nr:type II toxin-antitoxin system RelE/ParE family toxin [Paracoccus sp. YLB-12]MCT4334693.1 type II toxin-antitoxin system RelE/ParE family toxin [Paracoccus sp. YLB-12]